MKDDFSLVFCTLYVLFQLQMVVVVTFTADSLHLVLRGHVSLLARDTYFINRWMAYLALDIAICMQLPRACARNFMPAQQLELLTQGEGEGSERQSRERPNNRPTSWACLDSRYRQQPAGTSTYVTATTSRFSGDVKGGHEREHRRRTRVRD